MSSLIEVSDGSFYAEVLQSDRLVIVDCWAPWCAPCKALTVSLEAIAEEWTSIKFVKLNVDANPGLAGKYDVRSVPTLLAIKDGQEYARKVGGVPMRQLMKWIDSL